MNRAEIIRAVIAAKELPEADTPEHEPASESDAAPYAAAEPDHAVLWSRAVEKVNARLDASGLPRVASGR